MQKLVKIIIVLLFAYIFTINNAFAVENLKFNDFISDNANILTESTESNLNNILHELQDKTKAEIAVVTLNSLNDNSIEDVALQIFRKYKFGDKKLNNGALFLIAPNERKVRFEIGYGLEGAITDSHAGMILDNYVIPQFKKKHYENGIIDGTIALANDVSKYYNQRLTQSKKYYEHSELKPIKPGIWIFIYFLILLFISYFYNDSSNRYSDDSYIHSSSSSSSHFGGGSSGGGGSSRSW